MVIRQVREYKHCSAIITKDSIVITDTLTQESAEGTLTQLESTIDVSEWVLDNPAGQPWEDDPMPGGTEYSVALDGTVITTRYDEHGHVVSTVRASMKQAREEIAEFKDIAATFKSLQ